MKKTAEIVGWAVPLMLLPAVSCVPDHLRDCPDLLRTELARPVAEIETDFASHTVEDQFTLWHCGMRAVHPPRLELAHAFASGGTRTAEYLELQLASGVDDRTFEDIVHVFLLMQDAGTYDVAADDRLMRVFEDRVTTMSSPGAQRNAVEHLQEIQEYRR